jgi:hypothetical protein
MWLGQKNNSFVVTPAQVARFLCIVPHPNSCLEVHAAQPRASMFYFCDVHRYFSRYFCAELCAHFVII